MRLPRIDRKGIATAELALLAPVLIMLMFAARDVADVMHVSLRLEQAVRAGAQYAAGNSTDLAAVRDAVIASWPALTASDVPMPSVACQCAEVAVLCDTTCPSGMTRDLTIRATRDLTPLLLTGYAQGGGHAVIRLP